MLNYESPEEEVDRRASAEGGGAETSSTTAGESLEKLGFVATAQEDGELIIVHQETEAFVLGWVTKDWASLAVENESYTFTVDQLDGFTERFWSIHGELDEYTSKYL